MYETLLWRDGKCRSRWQRSKHRNPLNRLVRNGTLGVYVLPLLLLWIVCLNNTPNTFDAVRLVNVLLNSALSVISVHNNNSDHRLKRPYIIYGSIKNFFSLSNWQKCCKFYTLVFWSLIIVYGYWNQIMFYSMEIMDLSMKYNKILHKSSWQLIIEFYKTPTKFQNSRPFWDGFEVSTLQYRFP